MSDSESAVRAEVARTREIDLTVFGRKSGRPIRVTLWIWGDEQHMYVRAGGGLRQDWPRNLLANPRAILHLNGRDIPVQGHRVTEPSIARAGASLIKQKYGADVAASAEGEPLIPAEEATFELVPESGER
ncbi:MAG TPA: nitroreductase/quinone reductase family protein [Chloroflexota bacterium]|nr:nitroreductase/quinone reductase family protein [Chloroflexota bacterium]